MAGRRFIVVWGHTADALFRRYRAERDGRLACAAHSEKGWP